MVLAVPRADRHEPLIHVVGEDLQLGNVDGIDRQPVSQFCRCDEGLR